jgi:hypothetical protein
MTAKAHRILAFFGILILILVSVGFTAVGWQTLRLECARHDSGNVASCEVQNGYLFGLFKTSTRSTENVSGAGYATSSIRNVRSPRHRRKALVSTVVLTGDRGDTPVFEMSSNVNADMKREIIRQVRLFLENRTEPSLRIEKSFSNLFGWIGLPLFLAVVVGFAYSILRHTR